MTTAQKPSHVNLFQDLLLVLLPFFKSSDKRRAWTYLVVLLCFSVSVSLVQVWMSYANRDMMDAFAEKNSDRFYANLLYYLLTICAAIPIGVGFRYAEERFAVIWREWLTLRLIKRYFFRRAYYQLRGLAELDNPDQRLTEDVKNFTTTTLSLLLIFINSCMILFAFLGVLLSISPKLVGVLIIYTVGGTLLSYLIGKQLVAIYYYQYQKEADLRYNLVRVKENAESIAFFRGEPRERISLIRNVGDVVANTMQMINWNRNLAFFTTGYNYLALVIPIVIIAPLYLKGQVTLGVVTQATGAFAQVLAALSLIITQFERISSYTAGVERLSGLWKALTASDEEEIDDPEIQVLEGTSLKLKDVTVNIPKSNEVLIQDLGFSLAKGKGLLIMGVSGSGKSSLLRTIAGLWNSGGGELIRPQLKDMMFLPQKPYLLFSTLRQNLQYPQRDDHMSDEEVEALLDKVGLPDLKSRIRGNFDEILDWSNILSLGEQQRLGFARLFNSNAKLAFLDESTSALDEENEERLYTLLRETKMTFVSVGHRSTLKAYHDYLLKITADKTWEYEKL